MCPVCGQPTVAFEWQGVEIDRCLTCGGVWLDEGELETITELSGVDPGELTAAVAFSRRGRRTRRRCPRCPRRLREIQGGRESKIVLDRCPSGHGIWFDRGELIAVVRSYADLEEAEVARVLSTLLSHEMEPAEGAEGEGGGA